MKKCIKCHHAFGLDKFYKHKQMADGHLNKCKECCKKDAIKNRLKNIEYYREYDRERGNRQGYKYVKEYRKKYPAKYKAHRVVSNAVRDKKLFRMPCEICGSESAHAHHDDYLKPLNVRWLCPVHHYEWHKLNGDGLNATSKGTNEK